MVEEGKIKRKDEHKHRAAVLGKNMFTYKMLVTIHPSVSLYDSFETALAKAASTTHNY